ncbi:MAG: TGS domain-containing protein [Anaerolineae bacterium]|nr:TGS domain-containing protein [Anaerolineae bacterium]
MPTNLPAEYYQVEEQYKAAETMPDKIRLLEELISTIPKHKGTDKLRADLRRRLSKMKDSASQRKGGSRQSSPFQIEKEGAGQVVIVGPANVGKSSLVKALTNADPPIAAYPFSTPIPVPGMMPFENIQIQLIDTPPLSKEYEEPQLMHLIRLADLVLLVLDIQGSVMQQFEDSLALMRDYRIIPLHLRDEADAANPRLTFKRLHVIVNKVDDAALDEDFQVLCELIGDDRCPFVPISANAERYFDRFKQLVYDKLDIVRIYSKPPGKEPNMNAPFVMRRGGTVEDFAEKVHKDFVESLKSARVWGHGVFEGQHVGRDHVLHDGDVVELKT